MMLTCRTLSALLVFAVLVTGCAREPAGLEIPAGTDVSIETRDGQAVDGRLVEAGPDAVTLQQADGRRVPVPRAEIRALRAVPSANPPATAPDETPAPSPDATPATDPARAADAERGAAAPGEPVGPAAPAYRDVQIPAGTVLPIELRTAVGSETSRVEDQVRGTLRRPIVIDDEEVLPAGTVVLGTVTEAERSGRVKGRARVAFRFATLDLPGERPRISIRTAIIAREAEGTKKDDAAKIGGGAAAGAVIGGIIGGGDGAAKGAAIGGGAGTGVVLATRGREVSLPAGASVSARLLDPVVVRVPR